MISDRFVVGLAAERDATSAPADLVAAATRGAFAACKLQERHISSYSDTIAWRDPDVLPGLRVSSQHEGNVIQVRLAQDLMGPVGPTDAYECVKGSLRQHLESAFGRAQVKVAS
jgi:hypothetical protein